MILEAPPPAGASFRFAPLELPWLPRDEDAAQRGGYMEAAQQVIRAVNSEVRQADSSSVHGRLYLGANSEVRRQQASQQAMGRPEAGGGSEGETKHHEVYPRAPACNGADTRGT